MVHIASEIFKQPAHNESKRKGGNLPKEYKSFSPSYVPQESIHNRNKEIHRQITLRFPLFPHSLSIVLSIRHLNF